MRNSKYIQLLLVASSALLCCTSCVSMLSWANPDREIHIILYTDGSCQYSFEGLDYGKRADQRWSEDTDLYQYYLKKIENEESEAFQDAYFCTNNKHTFDNIDNIEFEENWPRIYITIEQLKLNGKLLKDEAGNFPFRTESHKDIYSVRNRSIAEKNDENFFAHLTVGPGSRLNNKKINLKYGERFSGGTEFISIDSQSKNGVIYSPEAQLSSGKFMEIRARVRATPAL